MKERETIQELIDQGTVGTSLSKGSSAKHAVTALQTVLHWLGFDKKLKWEKYGADGDYGSGTTAAVADFAGRNGSRSNGERVTAALARKILARYDSLEELRQLAADVAKGKTERFYKVGGGDRVRIAALQTLLNDLGYGKELKWAKYGADGSYGGSSTSAVAAFAKREGLAGNGRILTQPVAQRIVAKLSPSYGPGWKAPVHKPTPAAGSLTIKSVAGAGRAQFIEVSDGVLKKRFKKFKLGLFTMGNRKPADFVRANGAELRKLKITQSEINVMIAVAENEGRLDAINTWDNSFLSFGMFQWTAGALAAKGELQGLLARIKDAAPNVFREHYGQHGLYVVNVAPGYVTGHFSLRGTPLKSGASKEQLRGPSWAFYFWKSGQDPTIQALEVKHALDRLDRFYSTPSYKVGEHLVSDLVTSEYGVGLLLDNHVNRPTYVRQCLAKALARTGLSKPHAWGDREERSLLAAYLKIRATHGNSPMTDAKKRGRVTKKYVTNGTISDKRGSFKRSRG